jgi:mono/diheme cytochrome c family protein
MSQTETAPAAEPAVPPDPIVHKSYAVPIWLASLAVVLATVLTIADEGWFRRPYKGVQAKYRETYSAYLAKVEANRQAFWTDVLTHLDKYKNISKAADDAAAASAAERDKLQAALDTANDKGRKITEAVKESKSEIAALGYRAETKAHEAGHDDVADAPEAKSLLEEVARIRAKEVEYTYTAKTPDGEKLETAKGKVGDLLAEALAIEDQKGELQRQLAKVTADANTAAKARTDWIDTNRANLEFVVANADDATRKAIAESGVSKYLDERAVMLRPDTLLSMRQAVEAIPSGWAAFMRGDIKQIHIKDAANWVDRCETCHLNTRAPMPITAAALRETLGATVGDLPAWSQDRIDAMPLPLFTSHPRPELLKSHDPERFGCSMCHNGNGVAITSTHLAHGENKHWLWPLFKKENIEAGCVQCHQKDLVLETGDRINAARDTFRRAGCWGCHKYEGFNTELDQMTALRGRAKSVSESIAAKTLRGENLQSLLGAIADESAAFERDKPSVANERSALKEEVAALGIEEEQIAARMRSLHVERQRVGPNLKDLRVKLLPEFLTDWVRNPRAAHDGFRPDTKMPAFRWHDNPDEEVKDVAAFLWQSAYAPSDLPGYSLPAFQAGDAKNGEKLFKEKGCLGCHSMGKGSEKFGNDYAANLSNLGEKNRPEYVQRWITNPRERLAAYDPSREPGKRDVASAEKNDPHLVWTQHTIMPDLRLTEAEARDITTYLTSQKREGVKYEAAPWLEDTTRFERGKKLVLFQGCAGCHEIKGLEDEKGIGTELTAEGSKPLERLDFGHHTHAAERGVEPLKGADLLQDAETLFEKDEPWYRPRGFFQHKIAKPDVFETAKYLPNRFDRLRMPQFDFSAREITDLTTLLLGSVDARLPSSMVYSPDDAGKAIREGWWIVKKYNCQACHQITPTDTPAIWSLPWIKPKLSDPKTRDATLPPTLVGAGARLTPEFLAKFLRDPSLGGGEERSASTRAHLAVRMPTFSFSDDEIAKLVRFLQAMSRQPFVHQPSAVKPLTEKEQKAALAIYKANGSCSQCHVINGVEQTAETRAPNFSYAQGRLQAAWMRRWIPAPTDIQPHTSMAPLFGPTKDEKTGKWRYGTALPELEGIDEDHVELMIRYILTGQAGK